ncbi:hypothetical protein M422DRAFT_262037 [Sphaerobolus stellatus SS14]|uniref:F-box domain-containing protein n=1 Tax=Sphaerobolus stellatus (strain SS14) TaxID=990650 RepID=A0A0C9UL67_SPHS4|nr:hypothetical protein M422DRAFT_262037 [Sphaerobolus stellatus SS14]
MPLLPLYRHDHQSLRLLELQHKPDSITHHIPNEVLALIFIHCFEDPKPKHPRQQLDKSPQPATRYIFTYHPHLLRSNISRVCKRWQGVLDGTPQAWAHIYLSSRWSRLPSNPRVFEEGIRKSVSTPLVICLHVSKRVFRQEVWNELCWNAFGRALILHVNRIRILSVSPWDIRLSMAMMGITGVPKTPCILPFAWLEGFYVDVDNAHAWGNHHISVEFPAASKTLSLTSRHPVLRWNPKTELTTLQELDLVNTGWNLKFLSLCPNLERLRWMGCHNVAIPQESPAFTLDLPSLVKLEMYFHHPRTLASILRKLSVPCLKSLCIWGTQRISPDPDLNNALIKFLSPSSLRHLELHTMMITQEFANALCPLTPTLTSLHLHHCTILPAVFTFFTLSNAARRALTGPIPRLETLLVADPKHENPSQGSRRTTPRPYVFTMTEFHRALSRCITSRAARDTNRRIRTANLNTLQDDHMYLKKVTLRQFPWLPSTELVRYKGTVKVENTGGYEICHLFSVAVFLFLLVGVIIIVIHWRQWSS